MSRRPRESESESEAEAEAEAPLRLDEPLAEEGLQDIDFDFDDPQERHAPSILGLLRKHPLADVAPRPALAALADLLAGDPRSVGTVVGSGGGDDLIGFVAAVDLAAYDAGAHAGVDAARACLGALAAGAARPVLVTHAFFVNTPPKVVAAAFQCFAADLDAAAFDADALVVPVRAADEDRDEAPRAKKARVAVSCASFHDDEFARARPATHSTSAAGRRSWRSTPASSPPPSPALGRSRRKRSAAGQMYPARAIEPTGAGARPRVCGPDGVRATSSCCWDFCWDRAQSIIAADASAGAFLLVQRARRARENIVAPLALTDARSPRVPRSGWHFPSQGPIAARAPADPANDLGSYNWGGASRATGAGSGPRGLELALARLYAVQRRLAAPILKARRGHFR